MPSKKPSLASNKSAAAVAALAKHNLSVSLSSQYGDESAPTSGIATAEADSVRIALSGRRWLLLGALCLCGFCNGLTNEFNSYLSVVVNLLGLSLHSYIYLAQMFHYIPLISSLPIAWFLDRFGMRATIYCMLLVLVVRNSARALLFLPHLSHWQDLRLVYWLTQGFTTSLGVAIYYCLPLKVSESWFSANERSLAWTLMTVLPIFGNAMSGFTTPRYARSTETVYPLAWVNGAALCLTATGILVGVTRSQPKYPPSERNLRSQETKRAAAEGTGTEEPSMGVKLKHLATDKNIILQLVTVTSLDALMFSINSVLQDLFSGAGLSQVFTGQFLATISIVATLIQISGSLLMKPTKEEGDTQTEGSSDLHLQERCSESSNEDFLEQEDARKTTTCKRFVALQCGMFWIYVLTLSLHNITPAGSMLANCQWWLVIVAAILHMSLRCVALPHLTEKMGQLLASSPISEATLSATQTIVNSLSINIYSVVFIRLRQMIPSEQSNTDTIAIASNATTTTTAATEAVETAELRPDYSQSMSFALGVSLVVTLLYLLHFDGMPTKEEKKRSTKLPQSLALSIQEARKRVMATAAREENCAGSRRSSGRSCVGPLTSRLTDDIRMSFSK